MNGSITVVDTTALSTLKRAHPAEAKLELIDTLASLL
jgi:hypothetical protein